MGCVVPLHTHPPTIHPCLQGGSVNTTSELGDPLTCLAASGGRCDALKVLVDCGADLTKSSRYVPPQHSAAALCCECAVCLGPAGMETQPSMWQSGGEMATLLVWSCYSSGYKHTAEGVLPEAGGSPHVHSHCRTLIGL